MFVYIIKVSRVQYYITDLARPDPWRNRPAIYTVLRFFSCAPVIVFLLFSMPHLFSSGLLLKHTIDIIDIILF